MDIACDMSSAPDTPDERVAEYARLFRSLVGRERTDGGVRFRFPAEPGLEEWVRDLAAREKACCAFFEFSVTVHDGELWWDATVVDDEIARQILEEFSRLPDTAAAGAAVVAERFAAEGLEFTPPRGS